MKMSPAANKIKDGKIHPRWRSTAVILLIVAALVCGVHQGRPGALVPSFVSGLYTFPTTHKPPSWFYNPTTLRCDLLRRARIFYYFVVATGFSPAATIYEIVALVPYLIW